MVLVLGKPRFLRFMILAALMVLGLGMFAFPSRVSALVGGDQARTITPSPSGQTVQTMPFIKDSGDVTTGEQNYMRLVVYGWALDPVADADPLSDYYIVFVSATVQAKAPGWCIADGRPLNAPVPSQALDARVLPSIPGVTEGTILPDYTPKTGEHGDATGSYGFDFSVSVGGGDTAPVGAKGGVSWSQFIFQWTIGVTNSTTSALIWNARKGLEGLPIAPVCNTDAWNWGYALAVKVDEGKNAELAVTLTGGFIKPVQLSCPDGSFGVCVERWSTRIVQGLRLPPAVVFETNPLVGSMVFNGTQFSPGQHAFYAQGTYSVSAVAPEGYVFDHWECGGGVHVFSGGCKSPPRASANPDNVLVTGNGFLKAVFAAKLTFFTDPPDLGSISFTTGSGTGCGSGSVGSVSAYSNGDWTYFSALPPDPSAGGLSQPVARFCANPPAGYKFDHWSSTGQFVGVDSPVDPTVIIALSGPSTIKAWFSPKTCCPSVDFQTNLNHNGGGSILIGIQDVTTNQLYYPLGGIVNPLAVPSESYVFDRWDISQGLRLDPCCGQTLRSNPAEFDMIDTCTPSPCSPIRSVIAHFLPKVTFETDPPGTGSISWGGCGPSHPGNPDGDWTYVEPYATATLCANTPTGYRFDHWTANVGISGALTAPYNISTSITLWLKPILIKAWFTNLTNNTTTPPSAPSAPSGLVAMGQYGHVDLAWNPPLSDSGPQVTSYKLYRGASFTSLSLLATVGNQLGYQDASASNGQVYYYAVTAVNLAGEGPPSNTDSARPGVDRVIVSPDPRSVLTGGQVQFSAVARAESGEIVQGVSFSWTTSVPSASITNAGLFKAGTIVGTFTEEVSASAEGINGYGTVIVQAPPSTRANTAGLSLDSAGPLAWIIVPAGLITGLLALVLYRRRIHAKLA